MFELTDKITIQESNLSNATKKDYDFRLGQFYRISPVKSDGKIIGTRGRICTKCGNVELFSEDI